MQNRSAAPAPARATAAAAASAASRVRLMYAAPVHKLSLLVAARAWPRVQHTYRFIDLILARRRKGQLAVETSGSTRHRLPDLPDEIWLVIKQFAAIELFGEGEDLFVFDFHGGSDDGLLDELEDSKGFAFDSRLGRARLVFDHLSDCDMCRYLICDQDGMLRTFNRYSKDIPPMLSDHGLKLVCYHLPGGKTFDLGSVDTDLDGEALVALVDHTAPAGSALLPLTIMCGVCTRRQRGSLRCDSLPVGRRDNARFARLFELMPADTKASHKKKHGAQGSGTSEDPKTPGWKVLEGARKA